jgi:hypothetical protein
LDGGGGTVAIVAETKPAERAILKFRVKPDPGISNPTKLEK